MTEPDDPRFKRFDEQLKQIAPPVADNSALAKDVAGAASGMRAGAELIAGPIAGGLLGYGVDRWLGTKPIFLVALLILGVITGFVNVWRLSNGYGTSVGYKKNSTPSDRE